MKIIIFGATGSIGRLAVTQFLKDGYQVTAFARSPEKLDVTDPGLTHVRGDALDLQAVSQAIKGHDAVLIVLGSGMSRKGAIRSRGTMNVIQAMHQHGLRRLVCQSTLGAHESWSNLNFFWKRIMFGLLLRPVFLDHQAQEDIVRASGLDWTIVRPSAFTDGPATDEFKHGFGPEQRGLSLKISRNDVAAFLTRQFSDGTNLHRAVAISN